MKKVILLILLLTVVTSTFSACGDTPATESSSESATNKVVAITTTTSEKKSETSSLSTETESVAETTPSVPETQGKTETTPEPVSEKKMNLNLLSDIGLTYGEISAKRGKLTSAYFEGGGIIYVFENGYGGYSWSDIDYEGVNYPIPTDENNVMAGDVSPLPKSQAKCGGMWYVQAKDIFLGLDQSVTAAEIEKMYNVEHYKSEDAAPYGYGTNFIYEDKFIWVQAENEGIVTPDSYLWIKPFSDVF